MNSSELYSSDSDNTDGFDASENLPVKRSADFSKVKIEIG